MTPASRDVTSTLFSTAHWPEQLRPVQRRPFLWSPGARCSLLTYLWPIEPAFKIVFQTLKQFLNGMALIH
jgi:hypothetical protein